jgi:hypothetical protein
MFGFWVYRRDNVPGYVSTEYSTVRILPTPRAGDVDFVPIWFGDTVSRTLLVALHFQSRTPVGIVFEVYQHGTHFGTIDTVSGMFSLVYSF